MSDAPDITADLRPLTADEFALVKRYPLPPPAVDAVLGKADLADALSKSKPTIDAWVREGMPVEVAGTNGRQYQLRLSLCYAWMCDREDREQADRDAADNAVAQMKLAFLGGRKGAEEGAKLSIKDQRALLENEHLWMTAARKRGELVHVDDLVPTLESAWAAIRDGATALPDRIGRDLSLEPADIERVQKICDGFLTASYAKIRGLLGDDDSATGFEV